MNSEFPIVDRETDRITLPEGIEPYDQEKHREEVEELEVIEIESWGLAFITNKDFGLEAAGELYYNDQLPDALNASAYQMLTNLFKQYPERYKPAYLVNYPHGSWQEHGTSNDGFTDYADREPQRLLRLASAEIAAKAYDEVGTESEDRDYESELLKAVRAYFRSAKKR